MINEQEQTIGVCDMEVIGFSAEDRMNVDRASDGLWRIYDEWTGLWKHAVRTKEQALKRARICQGTRIGLAKWNESLECLTYCDVEEVDCE